ncbi:MAG: phosphonate ABC transporter ATP-binding protein [Alphaproteobacteria bacterium]|nr:phosphonate ABC transporter ATP-binding protein [Alphaproteobacteria bacterium]
MIEIRGLRKSYGPDQAIKALKGVDLEIAAGEFVVVLGPSGAGKSTMLRCINRLAEPSAGEVIIDGMPFASPGRRELRQLRRKVAMIFQQHNLVKRLSVLKNVLVGRMADLPGALTLLHVFPESDVALARHCLEQVNLAHKAEARADTLSGGEQQRVGIARALAQQPKIMLADEPVASLDPKTSRVVLSYLKKICKESNIAVLCNLHQIDYALEFGERVVGLAAGEKVFDGRPEDVTQEVVHRIYPGLDDPHALGAARLLAERRGRTAGETPRPAALGRA